MSDSLLLSRGIIDTERAPCFLSDGTSVSDQPMKTQSSTTDSPQLLKHKDELMSLLQLLHAKTFSKRGYSWTGKMLSSMLLTLTHTYPLENKFANPSEWQSDGEPSVTYTNESCLTCLEFRWNHHRHWGKLYAPDEIEVGIHSLHYCNLLIPSVILACAKC